ncbi:unnamed protein product [Amoebophrya sp. A25]|nr:unnamed protein product [Amoebophrya sp. A25]|eukprot:GSA25T00025797001.1
MNTCLQLEVAAPLMVMALVVDLFDYYIRTLLYIIMKKIKLKMIYHHGSWPSYYQPHCNFPSGGL